MHPTGGSLRVFGQFVWLEVGTVKTVLSRPAHQPVTLTVGRLNLTARVELIKMKLDLHYVDPRLVELYDRDNPRGVDTDFYLALAADLNAHRIIDLGCGTGLLTCELAIEGRQIIGIDPSAAMLAVARKKPGAELYTPFTRHFAPRVILLLRAVTPKRGHGKSGFGTKLSSE